MEKSTFQSRCMWGNGGLARRKSTRRASAAGSAFLTLLVVACAVARPDIAAAAEALNAMRPADTSSPRATLRSFIDSCNELHRRIREATYFDRSSPKHHPLAVRVLDCLDTSELPEFAREELASEAACCLKEILDRLELPPEEEIPDIGAIQAAGGVEKLSRWQIPGTRITIARVEDGPRRHEYLFSPGTVGRAVEYYRDVKSLPYRTTGEEVSEGLYIWFLSAPGHPAIGAVVDRLPDWTREQRFGLAIWKWAGLLLALVVALLLMAAAYRLGRSLARRYHDEALFRYCLTIVFPIIATLIPVAFKDLAFSYLMLRGTPLYVTSFCADLLALLASLVVVFGVSNRIAAVIIASPHINPQGLDAQFIRIVSKLMSLVVSVVIFLQGGHYLGFPLTTLLASAGIGGLAIALAAQDTLKTLFGTIMLLTDKPFRVGERIIVDKYDGVVEDIGLRSTKIRLLTGHQATIPNDQLAGNDIENVGRRPYIRRIADVHIPLDTPRETVEKAVGIIRTALENHEGMAADFPPRVYFFDFQPTAFVIRAIYWYNPPQYWDFLAFGERLNFAIFRAFEQQGINFTLPARVTHTNIESRQAPLEVKVAGNSPLAAST
jgi:MscS family membrane protein